MNTGFLSINTPLACPLTAARRVCKGGSEVVALGGSSDHPSLAQSDEIANLFASKHLVIEQR